MWQALENVERLVAIGGKLFIAIYYDQGRSSSRWLYVKRAYNSPPGFLRFVVLWPVFIFLWWKPLLKDFLTLRPFHSSRAYGKSRGMSLWYDVMDWAGGLPFEVAKPQHIVEFYQNLGFQLERMTTQAGNLGCNEFVFVRATNS